MSSQRVQMVGCLPPDRSGVANYNLRFLNDLPPGVRVDMFAERLNRGALPQVRPWDLYPASLLGRYRSSDPLLNTLGNNGMHSHAYQAVLRHGGVAWFHDVSLAALHHQHCRRLGDRALAREYADMVVAQNYPGSGVVVEDPFSFHDWAGSSKRFCVDAVRASGGVVVHSDRALELLREDAGLVGHPALVVPLCVEDLSALTREPVPGRVVSLGFLSPAKLPEVLMGAVSQLPGAALRWAGTAVGGFTAATTSRRARRGDITYEITGYLTRSEYLAELSSAEVVVQLRDMSTWYGEASGAVNEALGAGVPVVTNLPMSSAAMAAAVISVPDVPTCDEVANAIERAREGSPDLRQAAREFTLRSTPARVLRDVLDFADDCRTC